MIAATDGRRAHDPAGKPVIVFALLACVLALRILHLSSALQSPLSYQPGPDEDYYRRFGQAVAAGLGAHDPEFSFMDPGYGYLLGAVFKLVGANAFAVYLLQALVDTATAYGILVAGRLLRRPRAGLIGALLYGVTSTAIMFCATLLKETCVASFLIWWIVAALAVQRTRHKLGWAAFGALCGLGIALRSTLGLLVPVALLLPGLGRPVARPPGSAAGYASTWIVSAACVAAGLALSLTPWSIRNYHAFGGLSPLPHNGGIVLDQVYNEQNPRSALWIPAFVNYSHPSEIWRGYSAEAERRVGHPLSLPEVDAYWRDQAFAFMRTHPGEVLADVGRKSLAFLANAEVPNNRYSAEERLFSPLLAWLPTPTVWLLAMGLAGLVWLAMRDRRWPIVAAPIAISWFTVAVFWAEDRFRFHAAPALALLSGIWIDGMVDSIRNFRQWRVLAVGLLAPLIALGSLYLGREYPAPAVRWDHVIWGYIKMGKGDEARKLAARVATEQPDNGPVFEALGYLAAADGHYDEAVREYQRAIALRPRSSVAHYNLAKAFLALGDNQQAAVEAQRAIDLGFSSDAGELLRRARGGS